MTGTITDVIDASFKAVLDAADNLGQDVEYVKSDTGFIATNGKLGGWVETKDGSFVSVEYAESLNRQQRRKRGIKL